MCLFVIWANDVDYLPENASEQKNIIRRFKDTKLYFHDYFLKSQWKRITTYSASCIDNRLSASDGSRRVIAHRHVLQTQQKLRKCRLQNKRTSSRNCGYHVLRSLYRH